MAERRDAPWPLARPAELAGHLTERINRFTDDCLRFAMFERWRRMYCLSTGFDPDNDGLSWTPVISGKSKQIIRVRVNDILRYQRAHHVLVIAQRPSPQARPAAHDSRATEVVPTCNALLDNAMGKLGGISALESANWFCQHWGSGWVSTTWDELAGREVPGTDEHEGDVRFEAHRPDCIVFDTTLDERTPHKWLMIAQQWDRHELAAEIERVQRAGYAAMSRPEEPQVGPDGAPMEQAPVEATPEQETEIERMRTHILGAASDTRLDRQREMTFRSELMRSTSGDDTVWVYNFHYPPTMAVPEGRYAMLFGGKILKDGPSVYSELPVKEHCAMRIPGTRFGYTHMWDLMGLQQVEDAHITAATTTAENVGMSGVWIPPGSDGGEVCSMVDGCRVWKTNEAPVAVDFLGNSAEKLTGSAEYISGKMTTISGLTETSLGNSSAASGKQEALQYAVAVSNSSDYGSSYQRLCEGTFNLTLRMYRAFAETDRVVQIAGRGQELAAKTFTKKDLDAIDGIDVENGAAILNSMAGVVEIADKLIDKGMITSPQQYLSLIANKRLDPVFDGPQRFEVHLERENEMLSRGEEPTVARTDMHPEEMRRHADVLNSPEARANPAIVEAVVAHLKTHDQEWLTLSMEQPSLAMALGIPAHPMMAQMVPPPGAAPAGANPGDAQPAPGGGAPAPSPAGQQDEAQRTIQSAGGPGAAGSPMGGQSMPDLPQSPVNVM